MSNYVWGQEETKYFYELNPDVVLKAVDCLGFKTTGRILTLNSMENRVYEIEIDVPEDQVKSPSDNFLVAKFYRPARWTEAQIREEHQFMQDLKAADIPLVANIVVNGESLFRLEEQNLFYCLYPKKGGRMLGEMNTEQLQIMGRMLARLHNVGEQKSANARIKLTPDSFGLQNLAFLKEKKCIPAQFESEYEKVVKDICRLSTPLFNGIKSLRIHGDCHWGNVISRDREGLFFIDFDDMMMGPAVQDIWLIVPGEDEYAINDRNTLMDSYESMREFDYREMKLIEPLRALRYIHFSAWIAKRWEDKAFQNAFPQFGSQLYWENQINDLKLQQRKIESHGLTWS
ncbi:MAG: serine/threonine protein kinase [Bacteriovoracaceae bacterium]|nr:serine/threonine protein kinase [Bacteriovoracaceae bacterium]